MYLVVEVPLVTTGHVAPPFRVPFESHRLGKSEDPLTAERLTVHIENAALIKRRFESECSDISKTPDIAEPIGRIHG